MRRFVWLILAAIFLTACQNGLYSGTLIFEGNHVFGSETRLPGDVFMRAGMVEIGAGAHVAGSIYMAGGSLTINGEVDGDIFLLDGNLELGPQAIVRGDLRLAGGSVEQAETAEIGGKTMASDGLQISRNIWNRSRGVDDYFRAFSAALLLAGLGALLVRKHNRPVANIGRAVVDYPLVSAALGLLILIVLPTLLVIMAFTIVLIPVALIIGILLVILLGYGLVALGVEIGAWLAQFPIPWFRKLSVPATTFGGTLLLMMMLEIPYLGDGLFLVSIVFILGALLLTRLGLRRFTSSSLAAATDPAVYSRNR